MEGASTVMSPDERQIWEEKVQLWRKTAYRFGFVIVILAAGLIIITVDRALNFYACYP